MCATDWHHIATRSSHSRFLSHAVSELVRSENNFHDAFAHAVQQHNAYRPTKMCPTVTPSAPVPYRASDDRAWGRDVHTGASTHPLQHGNDYRTPTPPQARLDTQRAPIHTSTALSSPRPGSCDKLAGADHFSPAWSVSSCFSTGAAGQAARNEAAAAGAPIWGNERYPSQELSCTLNATSVFQYAGRGGQTERKHSQQYPQSLVPHNIPRAVSTCSAGLSFLPSAPCSSLELVDSHIVGGGAYGRASNAERMRWATEEGGGGGGGGGGGRGGGCIDNQGRVAPHPHVHRLMSAEDHLAAANHMLFGDVPDRDVRDCATPLSSDLTIHRMSVSADEFEVTSGLSPGACALLVGAGRRDDSEQGAHSGTVFK